MRRFLCVLMAMCLMFSSTLFAAEIQTYQFDPQHSYVLWQINHLGFSEQSGKFVDVTGKISFDEANPANSKVEVVIPINHIATGITKLDEHLKSKDFFDAATFPEAVFKSDKIELLNKTQAKVYGTLTLMGVSKPVMLNVTLNKSGMNPLKNQQAMGFTAATTINRSDFGLKAYLPALSDQVEIKIGIEALLARKP